MIAAEAALEPEPPSVHRVGGGFVALYALAYMSTSLLFIAPLLVTLALKVNSLVGIERAPDSLALVAGIGALVAMVGNPLFGKMSDHCGPRICGAMDVTGLRAAWHPHRGARPASRSSRRMVHRQPLATLLAAMVAVFPDQVRPSARVVSGVLGLPAHRAVCGTFLVKLFTGNLSPCPGPGAPGAFSFSFRGHPKDRLLGPRKATAAEAARTFYVNPRQSPTSRAYQPLLFIMAHAFQNP
jgi:hypothetical protein